METITQQPEHFKAIDSSACFHVLAGHPANYNNLYHVYFALDGDKIAYVHEYNNTAHVFDTLRAAERRKYI